MPKSRLRSVVGLSAVMLAAQAVQGQPSAGTTRAESTSASRTDPARVAGWRTDVDSLVALVRGSRTMAEAVGRLLYLAHLGVLLWWLLDKTPAQRATGALFGLARQILPSVALTLRLPTVRRFLLGADALFREALFGEVSMRTDEGDPG